MESDRRLSPNQLRNYLGNAYRSQFWADDIRYGILDQIAGGEYLSEDEPACDDEGCEDCNSSDGNVPSGDDHEAAP